MSETILPLTTKQRQFVDFYLGDAKGNATEAARRCGYKDPRKSGWETVHNSNVRAHIDAFLNEHALTTAEILAELSDIGRAEWRDFLIIRTDPKTGDTIDVRMDLSNKVRALELLGKNRQLFTDRLQLDGDLTIRQYVNLDPDDFDAPADDDGGGV